MLSNLSFKCALRLYSTAAEVAEIGLVAPALKDRMQRAGDAMIGFQPIHCHTINLPNFFRLVRRCMLTPGFRS